MKWSKIALSISLLGLMGSAIAAPPEISQDRIDVAVKEWSSQLQHPQKNLRQEVKTNLQIVDVLAAEVIKLGLDKQPDVIAGLKNAQSSYYASVYARHLEKQIDIPDIVLKKKYDEMTQEIKMDIAQFPSRQLAEAALVRLRKGLSFEHLLQELQQPQSGDWITQAQIPPELASAVATLKVGQITSDILEINGAFYLMKLSGMRRSEQAPPFDQIKKDLLQHEKNQKVQEMITQVLKDNGIALPQ